MSSEPNILNHDLETLLPSIEVDSIRQGHQVLAEQIGTLCRLCAHCVEGHAERAEVQRRFESLIDASIRLFQLESELMAYSKYARSAPHRLDHERFLSLLNLHYRAMDRINCASTCRELLGGIAPRWHWQHIHNHDLDMAAHVAAYLDIHPRES